MILASCSAFMKFKIADSTIDDEDIELSKSLEGRYQELVVEYKTNLGLSDPQPQQQPQPVRGR